MVFHCLDFQCFLDSLSDCLNFGGNGGTVCLIFCLSGCLECLPAWSNIVYRRKFGIQALCTFLFKLNISK